MTEEIKALDGYGLDDYVAYLENLMKRKLNDFERELLPRILEDYKIPKSSLFLIIAYLFAHGKNMSHLENTVRNFKNKEVSDFESVRREMARITEHERVDAEIKRLVGCKQVTNQWRDYYAQWKEWGVSDKEITNAKYVCLKRLRSVVPQYMNGIIKDAIILKQRSRKKK